MSALPTHMIESVRKREADVGGAFTASLHPYIALLADLVDIAGDALDAIDEGRPSAQHAIALIGARVATEALAANHLVSMGYPVQAFTIVGTMLELMHTASYIGGDEKRAQAYFAHRDRSQAYPGGVKRTITAVSREFGLPKEAAAREYESFYEQMCMVKHGNPMAMSLGTASDDDSLCITIGPVPTQRSARLACATMQHVVRYTLLTLLVFSQHHGIKNNATALQARLAAAADRLSDLNAEATRRWGQT